jgi:hypothetical protein
MFVITNRCGRLGNRLQVFAHFIAFAAEHGQKVADPAFLEYAELFETTRNDVFCRYPVKKSALNGYALRWFQFAVVRLAVKVCLSGLMRLKSIRVVLAWPFNTPCVERELRLDDPDFLEVVSNTRLILAEGLYFADYPSLLKHADKVREYFRPATMYEINVNRVVALARKTCDILVGVHMRFGDYRNWQDGKFLVGVDRYTEVMRRFQVLHPGKTVWFLICSDEVHDRQAFSGFDFVFGTNHIIEDLYALASCDYLIGGNSTYSRWASFYGNVPLYAVNDTKPNDISLTDFHSFEEIVKDHMANEKIFPRF